jgi:hypothetical protein
MQSGHTPIPEISIEIRCTGFEFAMPAFMLEIFDVMLGADFDNQSRASDQTKWLKLK